MLAFVYLAYSMMAPLMESVPSFEETWIECLGDLAHYRMATEEADLRDREAWSGVAWMWYNKAADTSPNVGRIHHHLAMLARPNSVNHWAKELPSSRNALETRTSYHTCM
jgi:3-phenylpropionate/cinnamic acid dioxygenase small subunit